METTNPESLDRDIRRIVDKARDVWVKRLIDFSRRNTLLFYRDLKVGTLDLIKKPEVVQQLLKGKELGVEDLLPYLSADEITNQIIRDQKLDEARRLIQHSLISIQRKAISNLEEKGIQTLFFAYGIASWPAQDGRKPYNAPVILIPAHIKSRGRSSEELLLTLIDEPQINPVLLFALEEIFKLSINEEVLFEECALEEESNQLLINPACIFSSIERHASNIQDFHIEHRAVLGNFQFSKMAMVEDLKNNGDAMASNYVIAAIAGHKESRQQLAQSVLEFETSDIDNRNPADDYLVLDADSSQQHAIILICKGQNGVVQGPPGTGKSQTIANLITQSVSEGKCVLFVAEKRAALEAVIKRLNNPDVDLGHIVLDLHGASVTRKEVMTRLSATLDNIRQTPPVIGVEDVHREFEAKRRRLNEYVSQINSPRKPTNLSVHQIIGQLLSMPDIAKSSQRFRGQVLAALEPKRFDEVRQWILDGAAQSSIFLGCDPSPWNNAEIRDGSTAQHILDQISHVANELWPKFEELLKEVVHQAGVHVPETLDSVQSFLSVIQDARHIREKYNPSIFKKHPALLVENLMAAEGNVLVRFWAYVYDVDYRETLSLVRSLRIKPASSHVLLKEMRQAADVLDRWLKLKPNNDVPHEIVKEKKLNSLLNSLRRALHPIEQVIKSVSFNNIGIQQVREKINKLTSDQRTPYQLPGIHKLREQLKKAGLVPLINELHKNNVAPEYWESRLKYVWLYSTLESVLADETSLASFNGHKQDDLISEFVKLDKERIKLSSERVRRLVAERAIQSMNEHYDQADLVRKEANKRSRHISLRRLFSQAPDVLTRIAPCWVASPLSVSQLLSGGKSFFDLVIFDEASQVLQEEAVASIYRASQVVVAGDRHQLPPTTFFATSIEEDDELFDENEEERIAMETATSAIGGFESLLDTMQVFLPNWMLEWHYRSEDERLIAFSNEHIYDRRLVTFPSARFHQAIRHVLVPHDAALGGQEESASREVAEVIRLIIEHAEAHPRESLGVITMGIKHANRVQAALDRKLELRADLNDYFSLENEERFFIKNLETVQGDERDSIILTVGYGKSANGDLPHRFGPLTQETGHRRLNVAVTRARRRMTVVSSFSHQEVNLERSKSRGVKLLKAYLEYAASGGTRLPESEEAGGVELNAFEADIRDALEAEGILTRPQYGVSRYRIDLVAMHPEKHGRPVLAIECDGASYHSSATARDRDRLRQEHLMRLGWRFHRIWSPDWFYNREQEIGRAIAAYEEAVRRADIGEEGWCQADANQHINQSTCDSNIKKTRERGPRPYVVKRDNIDLYSDRELIDIVEWIASDGLLRTDEEIIREAFSVLPFRRLGSNIRRSFEYIIRKSRNSGDSGPLM